MLCILILQKNIQKELKKPKKKMLKILILMELSFLFKKNILARLRKKNKICINIFGYKNGLVLSIYVSDQKFEDSIDLLLLINDFKSHYVYIKDFDRFMFHKTKIKNKKWFCKSCLQCSNSETVLIKHKENCLSINDKESVKLEEE